MTLNIRRAEAGDWPAIWAMLAPVFRAGTTYAVDRDISQDDARVYWLETAVACYIAFDAGLIIGTFYIRANAQGGASHVCNCGYVTAQAAQGKGVAKAMCLYSQTEALRLGFEAMQFNMVLASNADALGLWLRLGFEIVGTLPKVFKHPDLGPVDGHILFKHLS